MLRSELLEELDHDQAALQLAGACSGNAERHLRCNSRQTFESRTVHGNEHTV